VNIILHEVRKIFNLKILAVIAALCALWYFMFLEFNVRHYPNGHPATEIADLMIELAERYGRTITPGEIEPFLDDRRAALEIEAEEYIPSNPVFAEVGIHNYSDFLDIWQSELADEIEGFWWAHWQFFGYDSDWLGHRIQAVDFVQGSWYGAAYRLERELGQPVSNRGRQRIAEILETDEYRGAMDSGAFSNTMAYFTNFAVLLVLSTLLLISPLITTDRARNIHHLQYTSKLGRRIMLRQLAAVLLSSALFTTAMLLIFAAIYSSTGVFMYLGHGLVSFHMGSPITLLRITFGGYMAIMVAIAYALSLSASLVAFGISRFSRNLMTASIKIIPAFIALRFLCVGILRSTPFTLWSGLYRRTHIAGIEAIVCIVFLLFTLAAALWVSRREKGSEAV